MSQKLFELHVTEAELFDIRAALSVYYDELEQGRYHSTRPGTMDRIAELGESLRLIYESHLRLKI